MISLEVLAELRGLIRETRTYVIDNELGWGYTHEGVLRVSRDIFTELQTLSAQSSPQAVRPPADAVELPLAA